MFLTDSRSLLAFVTDPAASGLGFFCELLNKSSHSILAFHKSSAVFALFILFFNTLIAFISEFVQSDIFFTSSISHLNPALNLVIVPIFILFNLLPRLVDISLPIFSASNNTFCGSLFDIHFILLLNILAPLDNLSVGVISHFVLSNHSVNFTLHSLAAFSKFFTVPFSANSHCTLFAFLTVIPPLIHQPIHHKAAHIAVSLAVANLHSAPKVDACAQAAPPTQPANVHCATPHNTVVAGHRAAHTNHQPTAVAQAANAVVAAVLPAILP